LNKYKLKTNDAEYVVKIQIVAFYIPDRFCIEVALEVFQMLA
jgi:hypothetical protein